MTLLALLLSKLTSIGSFLPFAFPAFISTYYGKPGAGKSYGALKYGILPELMQPDRTKVARILCSIAGIQLDKVSEYVGYEVTPEMLVQIGPDDFAKPNFWPSDDFLPEDIIVQPGDQIYCDEAFELFPSGEKVPPHVLKFFRQHRHHVHPVTGRATNIILLTQVYGDMHRSIAKATATTYGLTKLDFVDRPAEFRFDMYVSHKDPENERNKPIRTEVEPYDPEIFKLYHSFEGGMVGVEKNVDSRGGFWDAPLFGTYPFLVKYFPLTRRAARRYAPLLVLVPALFVVYTFYGLLTGHSKFAPPKSADTSSKVGLAADSKAGDKDAPVPPAPAAKLATAPAVPPVPESNDSTEYRLVGLYRFNDMPMAVVATNDSRLRYLSSLEFELVSAGPASHIKYNGKIVGYWTGSLSPTQKQGVTK